MGDDLMYTNDYILSKGGAERSGAGCMIVKKQKRRRWIQIYRISIQLPESLRQSIAYRRNERLV